MAEDLSIASLNMATEATKDEEAASMLTSFHQAHAERFKAQSRLEDITSFEYPVDYLKQYPALLETCIRVAALYGRLSNKRVQLAAENRVDKQGRTDKPLFKAMKKARRDVAPQLMLGLRDLNIGARKLDVASRSMRGVVRWSILVVNEIKRYRLHEPVASLYLPYLKEKDFSPDHEVGQAFALRFDMRELLLARDTAMFKVGGSIRVFKNIHVRVSEDKEEQDRVEISKLKQAKAKLEEGLEEWLAIRRHVKTLAAWDEKYAGNDLWQKVLEETMPMGQIERQIQDLEKYISLAREMIDDRKSS